MRPTDDQLAGLVRLLAATTDQEIDCAAMLDRVAGYLNTLRHRTDLDGPLRQVAQHLEVCPECREELVALIRAEGLDPARILEE